MLARASGLCMAVGADGLRGELTLMRAARALAALDGKSEVTPDHIARVAPLALRHRLRRGVLDETGSTVRIERALDDWRRRERGRPRTVRALDDAMLAARFCAFDPVGLGGMILRGGGEVRDAVIAALRDDLPEGAPVRRIPAHVDDDALLGGLDLGATLALGRPVRQAGVLAAADGGLVVLPMAERMSDATAARIASVLDAGSVEDAPVRVSVVALDDGVEEEEPPHALVERLAFRIDLSDARFPVAPHDSPLPMNDAGKELEDSEVLATLAAASLALGIDSARAPLFALRAARASAVLAGREAIAEEDVIVAVRLVLGPRATRFPRRPRRDAPDEAPPPPPPPESDSGEEEQGEPQPPEDVVLEAALASLPRDVLEKLAAGRGRRRAGAARGKGERRKSMQRGRPMSARAGVPRGGLRLSLIDTLRAAAPWQKVRDRGDGKIRIRRDDLRIRRFETRAETLTIFAVDASGSAAAARLAEAKGAVELLLAEAYVKRAQVALVAFRGTTAEILLPPTRSLTRARRALAELPGGGGRRCRSGSMPPASWPRRRGRAGAPRSSSC